MQSDLILFNQNSKNYLLGVGDAGDGELRSEKYFRKSLST